MNGVEYLREIFWRDQHGGWTIRLSINPLNAELNPICCLLALLGVHHFLRVSRITHDLSRRAACGRSPAEIVGSNPTGGMNICLL